MATRTRLVNQQLKTAATLSSLRLPPDIKKTIAVISRRDMIKRLTNRVFGVNVIIRALVYHEIENFIIYGMETRLIIQVIDNQVFQVHIQSATTSENNNTRFETHSMISFPVFETQRLGNILYYLLGTYDWYHDGMTQIPYENSEHIVNSFLNEEYFKVKLYKGVERNLRQMRWIKSVRLSRLEPISEEADRVMNSKMDLHALRRNFPFWRNDNV